MSAPAVSPRPSPLPSIIARPSPRTHSPLRSLSFHENAPAPDLVPMPPVSPLPPTPSGILLNKFKFETADGQEAVSPALAPPAAQPASHLDALAASQSLALGLGLVGGGQLGGSSTAGMGALATSLARVASPDGSTSGASVTSDAGSSSTAPSSIVGSPALKAAAFGPRSQSPSESIATLTLLTAPSSPTPRPRSRSPSPHCKFAPLPKIDNLERPGTRRNSSVQGTPLVSRARVEAQEEQFAIDLDDSLVAPSPLLPANASMGLIAGASRPGGTQSRRSSGSASGRSSSPSPIRRSASTASSRTHSPIMSRHSSTEALHLHYISGAPPRSSNRSSSRERAGSSTASEVLRRRDETPSAPASGRASPSAASALESGSAATSPILASTSTLPPLFSAVAAAAAPLDAGTTPAPRRTVFVEPPVETRELDELEEEDDESEGDDDGSEDDEDGDGNRDEENGDEDGSADEDEGDELPRATARGAAVEVVHWHKGELKN